ncbi:hypothetical protein B9Y60_10540 [Stenotrophomonas maltophilia]|uniref:type 4 pilus major pilin n=1 Tax=Stenotrophomonas maltophilia TaxID=40324 RepID=UPI000C266C65|nr:type 4 pilus major pilin [Stenotrophomonas maltophilia]PJL52329.1 hypothetical protein B9Y73_10540 [Stenotrophomonas maltophilia]PJL55250.1 hypothetical protein B9Y60_10540 [Stenotrophomonas maltophilia]
MKPHSHKPQAGWSLIETLLSLAILTAIGGATFYAARTSTASAKVRAEQSNIHELAQRVENSFGLVGNYDGVSSARIMQEGLAPETMKNGNFLWSQWGSVDVAAYPGGGYQITYYNVPQESCVPLASAVSGSAWDIEINGTSTKPLTPAGKKSFNPLLAQRNCLVENELIFVFGKDWSSSVLVASPLDLPPPPVSITPPNQSPETIIVGDAQDVANATVTPSIPPTQTGPVPTPPLPVPGVSTPSTPNPVSPPSTSTPSTPIKVVSECQSGYEDRTLSCATGEWGSWSERRVLACELASNPGVIEAWVPWQGANDERVRKGWNYLSGTCTTCPAPFNEDRTQWVGFTQNNCPAGNYGFTGWEREQGSNRTGSYVCPAGTTTLPVPVFTAWSGWVNTGTTRQTSNACVSCPGPSTGTQSQWVAYTAAMCPAGQYGLTNRELEQASTRSITYTCPAGTASLPAPSYGTWSAWANTGNTRAVNNGTCSNCPAGSSESATQWVGYTANNCPAGQYGYTNRTQEQVRSRNITYSCPAGTTVIPAPTYGAWSGWSNTGNNAYVSSVCNNCPSGSSESATQWVPTADTACPAGQSGIIKNEKQQTHSRSISYSCPVGTTSIPAPTYGGWSAWSDTGATRVIANNCVAAPPANNGICPSEPLTVACALYNSSGVRISAIDFDSEGIGYTQGEYARCVIGYRNILAADGFPSINGDESKFLLRQRGNGALTDWDNSWSTADDSSSYLRVFAKNADGTQGQQCYGEQKVSFNYEGK